MKVITPPNNRVTCHYCKAELEFTWDDVVDAGGSGGKHAVRQYKAVICPCCNSRVEVFTKDDEI